MTAALDLSLLPVARYAGQDYPDLLCLRATEAPRRAARGRESDRLILYLAMVGNAPLPPGKQDEALARLSALYYATPGSATSAMRKVAEALNSSLLERNLLLSSSSRLGLGVLTQVVVRGQQLYLAQSGPAHAFLITASEALHFYDAEMAESGVGQSRITPVSFFQATLQPNDTLLLAAQPAAGWSLDRLHGMYGQGPESLRRRLLPDAVSDVNTVLIQARVGKGVFYLPRPQQPGAAAAAKPAPVESAVPVEQVAALATPLQPAAPAPVEALAASEMAGEPPAAAPVVAEEAAGESPGDLTSELPEAPHEAGDGGVVEAPHPETPAVQPAQRPSAAGAARKSLAGVLALLSNSAHRAGRGMRTLLNRMLPEEVFASIPSSVMAFIALAVPIVMVTVASVVYFRLGRDAQYALLFSEAQQNAAQAIAQADINQRRTELQNVLALLDKAETYQGNSQADAQALRQRMRAALDELDMVQRVNYQPAIIAGLPQSANITRIVVLDDELYLLDSSRGSALRAKWTSQGYQWDQTFQCGPDVEGISPIGPLIDIAAWPPGYKPPASLLAMDAGGNVLYCQVNELPQTDRLAPPSAEVFGQVAGFNLDLGDSYVLDLPSNGLWIYWRSNFATEPNMFFNEEIPDLQNVIDFTVNRDDLYLLNADGSLTYCVYSNMGGVPTRCARPAYVDFRPGRENLPLVPPSPFRQIQNTLPPDPSLYLLEPLQQAIYHFSLRNLAFQGQYLPDPQNSLPDRPATAFAVDNIQRYLFLALGNQVYYAILP